MTTYTVNTLSELQAIVNQDPAFSIGFDTGFSCNVHCLNYLWNKNGVITSKYGLTLNPSIVSSEYVGYVGGYNHQDYYSEIGGESFGFSFQSLLPRCKAWTRAVTSVMFRLFHGLGEELSRVYERMLLLLVERNTLKTAELVDHHELDFGIPETGLELETYLSNRRAAINAKLLAVGRQDKGYYLDIAERLGFDITYILEHSPFYVGWHGCGDPVGPNEIMFYWSVIVPFHASDLEFYSDDFYDYLPRIPLLKELILTANLYKPHHTIILWDYHGPGFDEGFGWGFDCMPCDFHYPFGFDGGFDFMGFGVCRRLEEFNYFGGAFAFGFNLGFDMNNHLDASGYFVGGFDRGYARGFDVFYGVTS